MGAKAEEQKKLLVLLPPSDCNDCHFNGDDLARYSPFENLRLVKLHGMHTGQQVVKTEVPKKKEEEKEKEENKETTEKNKVTSKKTSQQSTSTEKAQQTQSQSQANLPVSFDVQETAFAQDDEPEDDEPIVPIRIHGIYPNYDFECFRFLSWLKDCFHENEVKEKYLYLTVKFHDKSELVNCFNRDKCKALDESVLNQYALGKTLFKDCRRWVILGGAAGKNVMLRTKLDM